jgi:hypothetical protein
MLRKPSHYVAAGAVLPACAGGYTFWMKRPSTAILGAYNPLIDPGNFSSRVHNKYFTLKSATLRIEVTVANETKKLMGVATTGVRAREWRNSFLKEDTISRP